jgi:hypothetical protein
MVGAFMSNDAQTLQVTTKLQADLLAELLEKAAASGPNARALADLYDEAQRVKKLFDGA